MTTRRDPDAVLAAWLEEGPDELPEHDRRAIVTSTRLMTQRRGGIALPWRDTTMNGSLRIALGALGVLIAAVGGLVLLGPGLPGGIGGPGPTPSPTPTLPTGGRITLTETGCTWLGNPGTVSGGPIQIEFKNDTDDHAIFDLHAIVGNHTWEDGVAFVEELSLRLESGEEWPPNDVSDFNRLTELTAGSVTQVEISMPYFDFAPPTTHGVVCAANTSPTGDVLTVFLVGPLEYEP
jgi:hypothetical protein